MAEPLILEFADGEYAFALKMPQILELQEKCGYRDAEGAWRRKPITSILEELSTLEEAEIEGRKIIALFGAGAGLLETYEIIRLALIGGNKAVVNGETKEVSAIDAKRLVEDYVHPMALSDALLIAKGIAHATVYGYEPKKKDAPKSTKNPSQSTKA